MSARSAVTSAQGTYNVAEKNLARNQTLLQAGAIAQRDLETAQTQAESANAALADAKSRLATAQKTLENARIAAPFDGIVSMRGVSTGDIVQPGTAMFTVVDPSTMRLTASVPSDKLSLIHKGTDVAFTVTGYPGRQFHGTITNVSPAVDPSTRQVTIIVSLPNPGHTLVAGLYADGRVASLTRAGIVVPVSAIDTRMQRPAVAKLQGGKVVRTDVTLGLRDPTTETVEVVNGVSAGDTLLVAAAQGITPGTPVKVQPPPADNGAQPAAGVGGPPVTGGNTGDNGGTGIPAGTPGSMQPSTGAPSGSGRANSSGQ